MNKEEIFNIFYGKEKLDVWKKFQEIENSIEESELLYEYFDEVKNMLYDEKPTIVRLCLSALNNLLLYKIDLSDKVESKLKNIDLSKYKDSMSPLIKKDIDYILEHI